MTGSLGAFETDDGQSVERVMPGDKVKMTVTLKTAIALEQGMHFAIREGGHTVGAGMISKILA